MTDYNEDLFEQSAEYAAMTDDDDYDLCFFRWREDCLQDEADDWLRRLNLDRENS